MKRTALALALASSLAISYTANASTYNPSYNQGVAIFKVGEVTSEYGNPNGWRIPAITRLANGAIIAAADIRYMGSDWSDIVAGSNLYKTHIATKVSYDGGKTWSPYNTLIANIDGKSGGDPNNYYSLATDPTIIQDPNTGNVMVFGLQNNVNLGHGGVVTGNPTNITNFNQINDKHRPDFIMFTSKNNGKTWDSGRSIYKEVLDQINAKSTNGALFSIVFQGPSGGMVYNNKVYVPIQAWATQKDTNNGNNSCTSGFMVTEDGGKTWKVSSMIIPDALDTGNTDKSSESSIFHLNGKIMLAVRNEGLNADPANNTERLRQVYEYDEVNDSWKKVEESFLPHDVARVETSSHNLSDSVYMVGFARYYYYPVSGNTSRRKYEQVMTNTGINIPLDYTVSESYTSITHDDDNIYVLYEGDLAQHDIFLRTFDWKSKEYANLNTQILNRSRHISETQEIFGQNSNIVNGYFGTEHNFGAQAIFANDNGYKFGVFHKSKNNLSEDYIDTVDYDIDASTIAIGKTGLFTDSDTIMAGYEYDKAKYETGSRNDINSVFVGYDADFDFGAVGYRVAVNYAYSNNDFQRDNNAGLGRTANFDSQSASLLNQIYKDFEIANGLNVRITGQLENVWFKHETFTEEGGIGTRDFGRVQGANNATVYGQSNYSNEVAVKVDGNYKVQLDATSALDLDFGAKYAINFNDEDQWYDDFMTMDVKRQYKGVGEVFSARDGGFAVFNVGAEYSVNKVAFGIDLEADTVGNKYANATVKFDF